MTTDKQRAETWRRIADCYESLGGQHSISAANARQRADLLDPPKPTWPDGTIAWVTIVDLPMKKYLGVRVGDEWRDGYGPDDLRRRLCAPSVNVKVEPLRVLADDEIALPREVFERFSVGSTPCEVSENYRVAGEKFAAAVMLAYADALDAEAGGQS